MFKITKLSAVCLLLAATFLVSSCKKNRDDDYDNDLASSTDNSLAESTNNDIETIAGEASENGTAGTYRTPDNVAILTACATVAVDTGAKTIVVTFDSTVACNDGHKRSGSLTFDFSGSTNGAKWYRDPGFKCTITSTNYVVDGNLINVGSNKVIENTTPVGFNPSTTNLTWTINADLSITKAKGGTFTWKCTRYKTLLNTSSLLVYLGPNFPINWSRAKVGLTGNASGTTAAGQSFSLNITSQLVRDFTCAKGSRFISGIFTFTPSGKKTRTVDYGYSPSGSGACDNWVKITINGKDYFKQY